MSTPTPKYERLGRTGLRREGFISISGVRSRLYLSEDHLLCVDAAWYTENYKRFYYRDIQAFIVRPTLHWLVGNLVWGALLAFSSLPTIVLLREGSPGGYFFLGLNVILLIGLIVHLALGRTCDCYLQTAVQTENLPPLRRIRSANKALAKLAERIAAAQPPLATDPPPPPPPVPIEGESPTTP